MCGRFSLFSLSDVLARRFGLEEVPVYVPRYNIAPSSDVVTVRPVKQTAEQAGAADQDKHGEYSREAVWMHWGVQVGSPGPLVINARSESLDERPMFRESVASRRCIVPADGFFEWRRVAGGRTPYWFTAEHAPFALAAVWSPRRGPRGRNEMGQKNVEGDVVIVTTESNPLVGQVHDRMPLILRKEDEAKWLDPATEKEALQAVMRPLPESVMDSREVPKEANDARTEGPQLIRPSPQRRLF